MHTRTPAARAIEAFGGALEFSKVVGRSISRVHRWTYPPERGGTDGSIPGGSKMIARILAAAKERDIPLTLEELILPAGPDDVRVSRDVKQKA